jgi:hypothetical protein
LLFISNPLPPRLGKFSASNTQVFYSRLCVVPLDVPVDLVYGRLAIRDCAKQHMRQSSAKFNNGPDVPRKDIDAAGAIVLR